MQWQHRLLRLRRNNSFSLNEEPSAEGFFHGNKKATPEDGFVNPTGNKDVASLQNLVIPLNLAERTGLEPATLGVTGRYSNQLNYRSK